MVWFGLVYGVLRHFQQYFSYILVISFIGGGNWRKYTHLSHNVVSSTPRLSGIQIRNVNGDRH